MDTQLADPMLTATVDGRYRVRGRVARGGVATVYTAVDERLERVVALKIIAPAQAGDPRFLTRFTQEAKAIARLTHPHVVAVYDQGAHEGRPYLVMEYVRGRTLREVLADRRRLDPAEALAVAEQVLSALAAAHRAGLVHRDVKPENILVAEGPQGGAGRLVDAVVKVADFGLARAVEASADDPAHLMATVAYVAPELVAEGRADARADIYAVGIVLFEMLTGAVPYTGAAPVDVAWQHVDRDVAPPSRLVPGLPDALDALVVRATRRDPGRRPSDAAVMLAEVAALRERVGATTAAMRAAGDTTVRMSTLPPPRRRRSAAGRPRRPARLGDYADLARAGLADGAHRAAATVHRLRRRWGVVPLVAAGTALLLAVGTGVWWVAAGRYTPAPTLVNLTRAEAQERAAGLGLAVTVREARHDEFVRPEVVLEQQPPAEAPIARGGTVTLVLSLGPERYQVPDVVGMAYDVAAAELAGLQLTVRRGPRRHHDTLPEGMVSATDPVPGTTVRPGTPVTLTVSKGRPAVSVPQVVGGSLAQARGLLERLGLVVTTELVTSDTPAGQVLGQSVAAGAGVDTRARITLRVSKGPAEVVLPRVLDQPCGRAQEALEELGLRVRVTYFPSGTVRVQQPAEGTSVPPRSIVTIGCM